MAFVFKTKVAMLDIIKKFAEELSQIGFVVDVPRLNNDEGWYTFYIDDEFVDKIKELKMSGNFSEYRLTNT